MNKKTYKLIKWYPGLPESWKGLEITVVLSKGSQYYKSIRIYPGTEVYYKHVEGQPEYWREEEQFEYVTQDGITICDSNQQVFAYNPENKLTPGPTMASSAWKLGESAWLYFSNEAARKKYIESLEPKFLFKTDDGVDVKEGDTYSFIDTRDNYSTTYNNIAKIGEERIKGVLYFSKKNLAKEWVIMNTPFTVTLRELIETDATPYSINISDSNKGKYRALAQSKI